MTHTVHISFQCWRQLIYWISDRRRDALQQCPGTRNQSSRAYPFEWDRMQDEASGPKSAAIHAAFGCIDMQTLYITHEWFFVAKQWHGEWSVRENKNKPVAVIGGEMRGDGPRSICVRFNVNPVAGTKQCDQTRQIDQHSISIGINVRARSLTRIQGLINNCHCHQQWTVMAIVWYAYARSSEPNK